MIRLRHKLYLLPSSVGLSFIFCSDMDAFLIYLPACMHDLLLTTRHARLTLWISSRLLLQGYATAVLFLLPVTFWLSFGCITSFSSCEISACERVNGGLVLFGAFGLQWTAWIDWIEWERKAREGKGTY